MDLIVVGASSLGKCVVQIARAQADFKPILVVDDALPRGTLVEGVPCLGPIEELRSLDFNVNELGMVIAIGNPRVRKEVLVRVQSVVPNLHLLTVIHPAATFLGDIQLGPGCIIFPGCIVGPNVLIGTASVLNANVSVGTGVRIGDFATLCPGTNIGSEAIVGNGVFIGMGAAVAQQVQLDDWCTLGALSFAQEDIAADATAVGAPARVKGHQ